MDSKRLKEFCFLLPKVELHAHLNGSLSLKTLKELEELQEVKDNDTEQFIISSEQSLSKCFELFKIAHSLTRTMEAVKVATIKTIQEFAEDNVIYLELRSTLRQEEEMTKEEYLKAIIAGVEESKIKTIDVKIIVSIDRRQDKQSAVENVELAIKYKRKYPDMIVGLDLSGDPTKGNTEDFIPILKLGRENGLKLTIHCGEVENVGEIEEILDLKPDRLGHATCIHSQRGGSKEVWDKLMRLKIPVELCLSSNLKSGTVKNIKEHHFGLFYENQHPLCIATDDKGVFATSLSEEYRMTAETFDLTPSQLWQISYNSINYSFTSETDKSRHLEFLNTWKEENISFLKN